MSFANSNYWNNQEIDVSDLKPKTVAEGIDALLKTIQQISGGHLPAMTSSSLPDYLMYMFKRSESETSVLVHAYIYLYRFKQLYPNVKASEGSSHRLALTAMMIASKFLVDEPYNNNAWVKISGSRISLAELNTMEMELLGFLRYHLAVTREEYMYFAQQFLARQYGFAAESAPTTPRASTPRGCNADTGFPSPMEDVRTSSPAITGF